jgi:hypothetical protein
VSHELSLEEAPKAYEKFDCRSEGWTKVVLHPGVQREFRSVRREDEKKDLLVGGGNGH